MKSLSLNATFLIASFFCLSHQAHADLNFVGDLGGDINGVDLIDFTLNNAGPLTIETTSWASGAGNGFDTYLALLDQATGNFIAENDDISVVDLNARLTFGAQAAGDYTVAVTQWQNELNLPKSNISDGFSGNGAPGFVDPFGDTQTDNWALDIIGDVSEPGGPSNGIVPEPSTFVLAFAAFLGLLFAGARRTRRRNR